MYSDYDREMYLNFLIFSSAYRFHLLFLYHHLLSGKCHLTAALEL